MPTLKVQVHSARNVPEGDYTVKISAGKNKIKTKTAKKSTAPEWNETFSIEINESEPLIVDLELTKKLGSKSLGSATIQLGSLSRGKDKCYWETEGFQNSAAIRLTLTAVDFGADSGTPGAKKSAVPTQAAILPPMPDKAIVEQRYNELMERLGLGQGFKHPTEYQTKMIDGVSVENKWAMVCQYKSVETAKTSGKVQNTPQFWTANIKEISSLDSAKALEVLRELQIVLGGENLDFLKVFCEAGGLAALLDVLGTIEQNIHRRTMTEGSLQKEDVQIQTQRIGVLCVQRLLNNRTGLLETMKTEGGVKKLCLCLDMEEDMRLRIVKILTLLCLMQPEALNQAGGHKLVIDGMTAYKSLK